MNTAIPFYVSALLACTAAISTKHPSMLTSNERARLLITPADSAYKPGCAVSLTQPPALDELLDSAALHSELERFSQGAVLLTVSVDSAGGKQWARVLSTDPNGLATTEIVESMKGPFKPSVEGDADGSPGRGWTYRFRLTAGPEPSVEVGRSIMCRPALMNRETLARRMQEEAEKRGPAFAESIRGTRSARIWVKIDTLGRPTTVQVRRSSGYNELDRIATEIVKMGLFDAATVDRKPVEVWIELPMSFNYGDEDPRRR